MTVISTLNFNGSRRIFKLPDEVMINPAEIIDNKQNVYRISLGRTDYTENEAAMYTLLFNAIDKQLLDGQFLNDITIHVCEKQLIMDNAFVIRTVNKYGRFYELEATEDALNYKDKNANKEAL